MTSTTSSPSSPERSRSWSEAVADRPELAAIAGADRRGRRPRRRPDVASARVCARPAGAASRRRSQCVADRGGSLASADAGRADRDRLRRGARAAFVALVDAEPVHDGDPQSCDHRARRDAGRRQADFASRAKRRCPTNGAAALHGGDFAADHVVVVVSASATGSRPTVGNRSSPASAWQPASPRASDGHIRVSRAAGPVEGRPPKSICRWRRACFGRTARQAGRSKAAAKPSCRRG